jgi:hypothetical protein
VFTLNRGGWDLRPGPAGEVIPTDPGHPAPVQTPSDALAAMSVGYAVPCEIRATDGGLVCFSSDFGGARSSRVRGWGLCPGERR